MPCKVTLHTKSDTIIFLLNVKINKPTAADQKKKLNIKTLIPQAVVIMLWFLHFFSEEKYFRMFVVEFHTPLVDWQVAYTVFAPRLRLSLLRGINWPSKTLVKQWCFSAELKIKFPINVKYLLFIFVSLLIFFKSTYQILQFATL